MTMDRLPGVRPPDDGYEIRRREVAYDGSFFRVFREQVRLPNGTEHEFEVLGNPTAVTIIPIYEPGGAGPREIVLVDQLRNALRGNIYEIPAGILEPDEDPLECARRELEEETGFRAARWTHVTTLFSSPGISGARMIYFLAEELEPSGTQQLEAGEHLVVQRFPLDPLIDAFVHGRNVEGVPAEELPAVLDGKTHIALYWLAARRAEGGVP